MYNLLNDTNRLDCQHVQPFERYQLVSIVDYGTYNPSIDITYFSGTNWPYWSSTTRADISSSIAWNVYFFHGSVDGYNKTDYSYVRCVRGRDYIIVGDFTDNGDRTVTESNTGLMWQQDEGGSMNWEDAISYCEDLSLAGYTDWRLPNIRGLESITDDSIYNPAIDTNLFPDAHASYYWSSTASASDPSYAWSVGFSIGNVGYSYKSHDCYVRCVRGGQ